MKRILVGTLSVLAVVLTGLVHGFWTERWAAHEGPAAAAARMDQVANVLGDWEGEPIEAAPRQTDGIAGYLYRRYVNRRSGHSVVVALFCGRSGPMSIHTPDVCYTGGGYDVSASVRHSVPLGPDQEPADFKTAQFFRTRSTDRSQLRIFWSWNAAGTWTAPENPRFAFARRPFLYKLYVIREMTDSTDSLAAEPSLELMTLLLPELQRCLFPPS